MIYDSLDNINKYKGTCNTLDCAIDFLMDFPKNLETGKLIIDGEKVFANIMTYTTKDVKDGFFEAHKQYLDIHIMLEGEEKLLSTPIKNLEEKEVYKTENDYALYEGQAEQTVILRSGNFALCWTEDGHMPGIKVDEKETIIKMVVKVKLNEED